MRLRVAEVGQNSVAHILGHESIETPDHRRNVFVVPAEHLAQVFRVKPRRNRGRADEVADHDSETPAFGTGYCRLGRRIYGSFQKRGIGQRSATETTVAIANRILATAGATILRQRRAAVPAESVAILIGASAARALHARPPARNRKLV